MNVPAAVAYARKHALEALLVACGDEPPVEEYGEGFDRNRAHPLYSGTKSFWGVAALQAERDGLLTLDEPVAQTMPAWQDDPWKRRVTLRMLLALTAGFAFGGLGASVPLYERALAMPLKNEPGTTFTYGGIPLQIFGAVLARKLERQKRTPHEYLRERVLADADVTIANWRTLSDGTLPLPTGAALTARDWLAYGQFVLRHRNELSACFQGSTANPRYGLAWWLAPAAAGIPTDIFYASGSGGQAMYAIPSLDCTVVHFGKGPSYKHETFLKRFFN